MELTHANLLEHLAEFSCNLKYEDLPKDVVREAKRHFLDSLGCALGGTKDPAAVKIRKHLGEERTALCNSLALGLPSLSLEHAANANTHLIRVLDFNDTYLSLEPAHPSDNWGGLIALLGYRGGLSGKDLITAGVLAYEIQCRFCDAASLRKEGVDHVFYLALSSAFAAGKVLGLGKEEMQSAASLALRWFPSRQVRAGSRLSECKGLSAAEAVEAGVKAARLASFGATGPSEMIEGEFGLVNLILNGKSPNLGAFSSLGEEFKILKTHIKKWPVEYHAQAAVDAALAVREIVGDIEKIKTIEVFSYEACKSIIGDVYKRSPDTKETADHSIYFILAAALLHGGITLEDYSLEKYLNPEITQFIYGCVKDVEVLHSYDLDYSDKSSPTFPIMLIPRDENQKALCVVEVKKPKGHFLNPMTDRELENKFWSLCEGVVSKTDTDNLVRLSRDLENLSSYDLYWRFKFILGDEK